jgi:hypothetical protein
MEHIFQSGGELPSRLQPLPSATAPWLAIQSVQFSGVVHDPSTADACRPSLRIKKQIIFRAAAKSYRIRSGYSGHMFQDTKVAQLCALYL